MQAGRLRHRVTLQRPGGARDAVGERQTTWTDVVTTWANISPLSLREAMMAEQLDSEITHRVRLRYETALASLDASWRVLYGNRKLVITGVRNIDERDRELELICTEGTREE